MLWIGSWHYYHRQETLCWSGSGKSRAGMGYGLDCHALLVFPCPVVLISVFCRWGESLVVIGVLHYHEWELLGLKIEVLFSFLFLGGWFGSSFGFLIMKKKQSSLGKVVREQMAVNSAERGICFQIRALGTGSGRCWGPLLRWSACATLHMLWIFSWSITIHAGILWSTQVSVQTQLLSLWLH